MYFNAFIPFVSSNLFAVTKNGNLMQYLKGFYLLKKSQADPENINANCPTEGQLPQAGPGRNWKGSWYFWSQSRLSNMETYVGMETEILYVFS